MQSLILPIAAYVIITLISTAYCKKWFTSSYNRTVIRMIESGLLAKKSDEEDLWGIVAMNWMTEILIWPREGFWAILGAWHAIACWTLLCIIEWTLRTIVTLQAL